MQLGERWSKFEGRKTQDIYNTFEQVIKEAVSENGKRKMIAQTDDKLSSHTKAHMEKREALKKRTPLTLLQKVELTEIHKSIRKEVRKDILSYENEVTREIIEETWSARKVKKALARGFKVINKLKDEKGIIRYGKNEVLSIGTNYYKKLYTKQQTQSYSDCLLYTSPSPRDRTRSRMPSSA